MISTQSQHVQESSMLLGSSEFAVTGSELTTTGRDAVKVVVQVHNSLPGIGVSSSKQDIIMDAEDSLKSARFPWPPLPSMSRLFGSQKSEQNQETENEQGTQLEQPVKEEREYQVRKAAQCMGEMSHLEERKLLATNEPNNPKCESAIGSERHCQTKLGPIADVIDLMHTDVAANIQTVVKKEACTLLPLNGGNLNSAPEIYTHHMLYQALGYPLYIPEPDHGLSNEYRKRGVRLGDVGSITPEGAFDFLFNICLPRDHPINPLDLPDDFEMLTPGDISIIPQFIAPGVCIYSDGIRELDDQPNKFRCMTSDGAVLAIPGGAALFKAKNTPNFQDFAARHAENWYKYMVNRGRHTPNGSLYLVTGCVKSKNWGIATFYKESPPDNYVQLIESDAPSSHTPPSGQATYHWKKMGRILPRIGPSSDETGELNQCDFLYGYKIMLRQDLLDRVLCPISVPSQEGQDWNSPPASNRQYGAGTSSESITQEEPHLKDGNMSSRSNNCLSGDVIIEADFRTTAPVHPSDLINSILLQSDPGAKVAITHDDVWCDTLLKFKSATGRSGFVMDDILDAVRERYSSTTDEFGCISLQASKIHHDDSVIVYEGHCDDVKKFGAIGDHLKNDTVPTMPDISESLDPKQASKANLKDDVPYQAVGLPRQQAFQSARKGVLKKVRLSAEISYLNRQRAPLPFISTTALPSRPFDSDILLATLFTPIPSYDPIATQLHGAYGFRFNGNPNLTNIGANSGSVMHVNNYNDSRGLEILKEVVSFDALNDSYAQDPDRICHPGTRVGVLKQIQDWVGDRNSAERVFWLHGPAGAGKSAIAQTIARSFTLDQTAATFFFNRSDPSCSDGNRLFTTIAWQLALSVPAFKDHIVRSLDERPDLPRKDIETQFKELIVRPFQALKDTSTLLPSFVIIIDGVDECTDDNLQRRFLKLIGNAVKDESFPLRFLIGSGLEIHIQETIDRFPKPNFRIDLATLDDANHDVEKYLRDQFSRIAYEQGLDSATWPGDQKIKLFISKSSGNFIYPSTVIRYADDEYNSVITQLDIILGLKQHTSKSPFAELDALYVEILKRQPDQDFLKSFLALLVARLLIPNAHDDFHLADAMLMNESELRRKLRGMRSLLKFKPHIDLYHRSFLDFLQDSSRSGTYHMSKEHAQNRYLDLIPDSIVRFAKPTIDQPPSYHEDETRLPLLEARNRLPTRACETSASFEAQFRN